eukprot:1298046-Pleurochrysis_carterae.AAC.1
MCQVHPLSTTSASRPCGSRHPFSLLCLPASRARAVAAGWSPTRKFWWRSPRDGRALRRGRTRSRESRARARENSAGGRGVRGRAVRTAAMRSRREKDAEQTGSGERPKRATSKNGVRARNSDAPPARDRKRRSGAAAARTQADGDETAEAARRRTRAANVWVQAEGKSAAEVRPQAVNCSKHLETAPRVACGRQQALRAQRSATSMAMRPQHCAAANARSADALRASRSGESFSRIESPVVANMGGDGTRSSRPPATKCARTRHEAQSQGSVSGDVVTATARASSKSRVSCSCSSAPWSARR